MPSRKRKQKELEKDLMRDASKCRKLTNIFQDCLETKLDREIRARIIGVNHQMTTFDYYFSVKLGSVLLKHSDNLSKTLQQTNLSAGEGQTVASLTVKTLQKIRTENDFKLFWENCNTKAKQLKIGEPVLPRKRQLPLRNYFGNAPAEFPDNEEDHYRQIYFEAIETVIGCIEKRFEQNDYTNYYSKLENLLLYSARGEPYEELLSFICKFCKEDINKGRLEAQLPSLKELFKDEDQINISNIIKTFRNMSTGIRGILF